MKYLLLLLTLALSACGGTAAPAASSTSPKAAPASSAGGYKPQPLSPAVKVKAIDAGTTSQVPLYVALDRGYFKDEGLDVELIPMADLSQAIQQVALSQVAFQVALPDPVIFNALDRGVEVKILASSTINRPVDAPAVLQVRQDLIDSGKYKGPSDLKGANIGLGAQSSQFYVERFLKRGGLGLEDVQITNVRAVDTLTAFKNKGIDAGWVTEPIASASQREGLAKTVATTGELFPGAVATTLVMAPQFAKEQPQAAQRFVIAYLRGLRDYYHAFNKKDGDKAPVVQALVNHFTVKDPALYDVIGLPSMDPNASTDPTPTWSEFQEFYLRRGITQRKVDLARYVDFSLVNAALEKLGRE